MVVVFQDYTRAQILGRTSRLRMIVRDGTYKPVEGSVLSVPDRIDVLYFQGDFFVFDQRRFEKIFDYHDEFERAAAGIFDTLSKSDIPFADIDMFREAVMGNKRALRLFYEVEQRGKYRKMDASHVEMVNQDFNTYILFIEDEKGNPQLGMRDKRDVWRLLRFLNDDHVTSPITNSYYVSRSKEDADT
jgi:hypothetical protein